MFDVWEQMECCPSLPIEWSRLSRMRKRKTPKKQIIGIELHPLFRLHFGATLQPPATRIKKCVIIQKVETAFAVSAFCISERDSNNQIAICQWHMAATSSKTGCYLYLRTFPCADANESRHSDHIRTKVMIPLVLQLSFFFYV